MRVVLTEGRMDSARRAAGELLAAVRERPDCTLGLATGSTAEGVYPHLVAAYQAGEISFARTRTINLDEYVGLEPGDPRSYRAFMERHLFGRTDFDPANIYVPDGSVRKPHEELAVFRARIAEGIDVQLLGLGANGHIAFNEPHTTLRAEAHLERLSRETLRANARFFDRPEEVPRMAMTMGMGDILRARRIVLVISGEEKREAAEALLHGDGVSTRCPVTFLKLHSDVTVFIDRGLYKKL